MLSSLTLPTPFSVTLSLATLVLLPSLSSPTSPSFALAHFNDHHNDPHHCHDGSYYSFRRHSCQPCGRHVETCSGPDQATSCVRGFVVRRGECVRGRGGGQNEGGWGGGNWARADDGEDEGGLEARDFTGGLIGGLLDADGDQEADGSEDVGQGEGGLVGVGVGSVDVSDLLHLRARSVSPGGGSGSSTGANSGSGSVNSGRTPGQSTGDPSSGGSSLGGPSANPDGVGIQNGGNPPDPSDGGPNPARGSSPGNDGCSSNGGSRGRNSNDGSNNGGSNNNNGASDSGLDFGQDDNTDFGGTNGRFCASAVVVVCTDTVRIRHGRTHTSYPPCETRVVRRGRNRDNGRGRGGRDS